MTGRPLRVVKLGGSLLDWPGVRAALPAWLSAQPPGASVMVVGGGRLVEVLRAADRTHGLGTTVSHELAVRAMTVNAHLAAALWPKARWVEQLRDIRRTLSDASLVIFDTWSYLHDEHSAALLPKCWALTSDSIAASVAIALGARELVLLKSALPSDASRHDAANGGYVDELFPEISADIEFVRCVDLSADGFPEIALHASTDAQFHHQ